MFLPILLIFFGSTNFTYDLLGSRDIRPGTWGYADAKLKTITFAPPAGYHTRLLNVRGDIIAWLRQPACCAGALISMQTTAPDGSIRADWLADNCFFYHQLAIGQTPVNLPFNETLGVNLPDNRLVLKAASFLNETSQPIHLEVTAVFVYEFIPDI
jgi:hypothetical protein